MAKRVIGILACWPACVWASGAAWHGSLYLGNGGDWRQRIRVEIRNGMDREAAGEPAAVRIGKGEGEADLVGAAAEAVRVCDAKGTEMLFGIIGPDEQWVTRGPIGAGSRLFVPVECPSKGTADYYVYFDNASAWCVPDFFHASLGVRNGGVERGTADAPSGWQHDAGDEQHRSYWVGEHPHTGKRCLKTVAAEGAKPTWIATRQGGIHIIGGAKYVMEAWVKAEDVKGFAGWYIHVGNTTKPMMIAPMLKAGEGSYDWKKVSAEFTAPADATVASLGTVLWGTGTAWFDDVRLECQGEMQVTVRAGARERLPLREVGADAGWYDDNPNDDVDWEYRVPVKVRNFSSRVLDGALIHVDLSMIASRLRGRMNAEAVRVTDGAVLVRHYRLDEALLFEGQVPAHSARTYYVYVSTDGRIKACEASSFGDLVTSGRNRVKNGSFEDGEKVPADWHGASVSGSAAGVSMGLGEPGCFGRRCAKTCVEAGTAKNWYGWRQDVLVEAGKTYLLAAWVKCRDVAEGSVQLHAHYRNATGGLCKKAQFTSAGSAIEGTKDWTLMSGQFTMPEDIATFQLHLTMHAVGTVWHDGVVLAEVMPGSAGGLEARRQREVAGLTVWPVNAIVKVFQDDFPPEKIAPARISAARNEKEPLQLAVRSPKAIKSVAIEVDAPTHAGGAKLAGVDVGVVGYVPIDHKTSYYQSHSPTWHRKYPTSPGRCDGWPGLWPDPLLPRSSFDLAADRTQPIWITVVVPKEAPAGDYAGRIRLVSGGRALKEIPFTVHVWDFALPDESHVKAIYDLRIGAQWRRPGKSSEELYREF